MPTATTQTTALLDRLEIILEALSEMPASQHTESALCQRLRGRGQRPIDHFERTALAALGRQLAPS
ncbi:MAG: hypothetical protein LBG11_11110 [Bifidobacteriaceae bacterium]|jgi:hypothetical protein|nr:hypothetical protein [Bifidobacteriaceae bacterium]